MQLRASLETPGGASKQNSEERALSWGRHVEEGPSYMPKRIANSISALGQSLGVFNPGFHLWSTYRRRASDAEPDFFFDDSGSGSDCGCGEVNQLPTPALG